MTTMNAELREHIRGGTCDLKSFRRIQELLPADDRELDLWIAESLEQTTNNEFGFLVIAPFGSDRPVVRGISSEAHARWLRPEA
jgi:hypothetical protein